MVRKFDYHTGMHGQDKAFFLKLKNHPYQPQYPAKVRHCERSEAISIF